MTRVKVARRNYYLKYLDPQIVTNFSVGYTMVMELANPLLSTWNILKDDKARRNCFSKYFTTADLEALRTLARQYSNYSKSPLILYANLKRSSEKGEMGNILGSQTTFMLNNIL